MICIYKHNRNTTALTGRRSLVAHDILVFTLAASFALQVAAVIIPSAEEVPPVPIDPQYETTTDPRLRRQTDPSSTNSSNLLEWKSDGRPSRGNRRGPHPSCGGTEPVRILSGTADDADVLRENVPAHRCDAV